MMYSVKGERERCTFNCKSLCPIRVFQFWELVRGLQGYKKTFVRKFSSHSCLAILCPTPASISIWWWPASKWPLVIPNSWCSHSCWEQLLSLLVCVTNSIWKLRSAASQICVLHAIFHIFGGQLCVKPCGQAPVRRNWSLCPSAIEEPKPASECMSKLRSRSFSSNQDLEIAAAPAHSLIAGSWETLTQTHPAKPLSDSRPSEIVWDHKVA